VWWKPSHPFARNVRHTEALSTLPISLLRTREVSPGSRWAFLHLSIMTIQIADERRWIMVLIQLELTRIAAVGPIP